MELKLRSEMVMLNRTPLKRFGEFNSKWSTQKLGYLVTWASGGTPSKSVDEYWNGEIPWISASSMRGLEYRDSEIKITAQGLINGSKLARKGNLLLLVRGSMLFNKIPIGIVGCDVSFNQDVKSLACKADIIPKFLLYWFYASEHKLLNMVVGTGIGAGKLDLQDLKLMDVVFPSLPEQQRVASVLTAVDDKIQHLSKKKVLLEQYKRGLMQQVFSQKLRFKDDQGNKFTDWEVKQLGELYGITSSKRVFQSEWTTEGVPFYRAREIVKLSEHGTVNSELFISIKMYEEYKAKYGVPLADDLLVTGVGTIGILYLVKDDERFYFKDGNIIWFKCRGLVLGRFVKQLFNSRIIQAQIQNNASITTVGTYTIDSAKKTSIPYPCLDEQNKIATFISAIDDKINTVKQQIEHTRQFKKGLLQQLFI